ncbi:MAG TPA: hypothetical protein VGO23_07980 [Pseudonocardia sp.]|nr:hypothetical protein [Pseudonocardia sp.]
MLSHRFSHGGHPDHAVRLGGYGAEVFGGPPGYSTSCGGHPHMLRIHAGSEPEESMGPRFVECFVGAADDAGLPADPELRRCCARTWSGRCPGCWTTPRRGLVR